MVDPPPSGVLVLRVERQDDYVLYTVVAELWPTAASAEDTSREERAATTDRDEVVRVVEAFLDRF
jgi:hypothetical protein